MIIDELQKQFEDMPNLRAREIRVDKQLRKVFCTLSYPDLTNVDAQKRRAIADFVKSLMPKGYACAVSFANDRFTELSFRRLLMEVLKSKFPVFSNISRNMTVSVSSDSVSVEFKLNSVMERNVEESQLLEKLDEFFKSYTSYVVKIGAEINDSEISTDLTEQEKLVHLAVNRELLKPSRYFKVDNVVKHIGKPVLSAPMYISDIRKPSESCVICGNVSAKTLKASKNTPNLYVCRFTVSDASGGAIPCVIFTRFEISDVKAIKESMGKSDAEAATLSRTRALANDRKMKKMMNIYEGMSVVARGKVAYNSFSGQLEMTVYDLSKCNISPIGNAMEYNKKAAAEYLLVHPEVYEEYSQETFVHRIIGKSLLSDKKYAVLHVNCTGLNVTKDKLYAVCAVKLSDGHITEKFFTYINPETEIAPNSLSAAETSYDKLVFYPTITEIVSDLYKFTYDCDLIGTDLPKILDLLNYYAAPVGYRFVNTVVAQTEFISSLFDNRV
ncbi:MAG: hypothetical protein NC332_01505, partial [Firmicutes bacterium]|nr:hypothetical protein [Bacillota bacterium]